MLHTQEALRSPKKCVRTRRSCTRDHDGKRIWTHCPDCNEWEAMCKVYLRNPQEWEEKKQLKLKGVSYVSML